MSPMNSGVGVRIDLPTMTRICSTGCLAALPASNAHKRNEGKLIAMTGPPDRSGSQRMRSIDNSIWRTRTRGGTASASMVGGPGCRPGRVRAGLETV